MAGAVPTALPDGTSRLRVDAVRIKIDSCARIDRKCPVDVRAPIHCFQCQAKREADQHREPPRRRNGRQTRVRHLFAALRVHLVRAELRVLRKPHKISTPDPISAFAQSSLPGIFRAGYLKGGSLTNATTQASP